MVLEVCSQLCGAEMLGRLLSPQIVQALKGISAAGSLGELFLVMWSELGR